MSATTIEIYRTDLTTQGVPEKLGGYGEIALHTALEFMEGFAEREADSRPDVGSIARVTDKRDDLRITRFVLMGAARHSPALVEYTYKIVEHDDPA